MVEIDRHIVSEAAGLSRLFLSEKEIIDFTRDLTEILDYVKQLQAIPLEAEKSPVMQVGDLYNVVRDDLVTNYPDDMHGLFRNSQSVDGDFLLVKSIKE